MDIAITLITSSPGSAGWCLGWGSAYHDEAEPLGACNKAEPCYKKMAIFASN